MRELKLRRIGEDDWNRDVFKDEDGYIYKRYQGDTTFYTASEFYGEPTYSVRSDIKITISEE